MNSFTKVWLPAILGPLCAGLLFFLILIWCVPKIVAGDKGPDKAEGAAREQRIETCASYCSEISWSVVCDETFDTLRGRLVEDEAGNDVCLCYVRNINFHPWQLQGEGPWASE